MNNASSKKITISIVSHNHGEMVLSLIKALDKLEEVSRIILTINIPENITIQNFAKLHIINNGNPKGFGENHNAAFLLCKTDYFCVLNPDVSLSGNPFTNLLQLFISDDCCLTAPSVKNLNGEFEDSARYSPTPIRLFRKIFLFDNGSYNFNLLSEPFEVECIAGMFMLFRSEAYKSINGFDTNYYMYYEDMDICLRLRKSGWKIIVNPLVIIFHQAHRTSRRNLRYLRWHVLSMVRFFLVHRFNI